MKVIRSNIKYILLCPLVIAFFIATPVEASDSLTESKEEVEETKLYFKVTQAVKQKPKRNAEPPFFLHSEELNGIIPLSWGYNQRPKYILYCNLIFYE